MHEGADKPCRRHQAVSRSIPARLSFALVWDDMELFQCTPRPVGDEGLTLSWSLTGKTVRGPNFTKVEESELGDLMNDFKENMTQEMYKREARDGKK